MTTIVVGPINSGKTTQLIQMYETLGGDEGFALIKNMVGDKVHSYQARKLSTGEERLFIVRDEWKSEDFVSESQVGPYLFSGEIRQWIETTLKEAVLKGGQEIFLDEIGFLELDGQGFYTLLKDLLKANIHLYIVIREGILEKVLQFFSITAYEIIRLEKRSNGNLS